MSAAGDEPVAIVERTRAIDRCPAFAPWVTGYKKNQYYFIHPWEYLDIDPARQRAGK